MYLIFCSSSSVIIFPRLLIRLHSLGLVVLVSEFPSLTPSLEEITKFVTVLLISSCELTIGLNSELPGLSIHVGLQSLLLFSVAGSFPSSFGSCSGKAAAARVHFCDCPRRDDSSSIAEGLTTLKGA